ncbi:ribonuclease H-like domain-containing protein [Tanacetum coccineum]
MKLMQFLMGHDDSYMQIRSSILSREVLPYVRSACATISSEESHRVASGSIAGSFQRNHSAFVSNMPNRKKFQRSNQNSNNGPRPNNLNNNRQGGGFYIGRNSHMPYMEKELDKFRNISHLKIKVTHPNGTKAFISKIENLKLPNGLVLFDVLDLNLNKVLGIGNQLGHPADPVLNVLKDNLGIENKSEIEFCETYFIDDKFLNDAQSSDDIFATQDEQLNKNSKPKSYPEASKFPHWIDAMNSEMDTLLRNDTWEIIDLPKHRKAIGSKWIFKIKYNSSGEIDRYKARLVAQRFGQKEGIDYEEKFSPIVKMSDKGMFLALLFYVDDIIITSNNVFEIEKFKVYLKSKFMIKDLGKLKYFLGIVVIDTSKGICLNQRKCVLDLLSEYVMLACKPAKTPLKSKLIISTKATENDPILDNITDYQKLKGKLIYLTNTRLDISYVVHYLSQFMHSPLKSQLKIAFKILRYLKSCPCLGIHIIKNSDILTKGLDTVQHNELVKRLGMFDIYQVQVEFVRGWIDRGLLLSSVDSLKSVKALNKLVKPAYFDISASHLF